MWVLITDFIIIFKFAPRKQIHRDSLNIHLKILHRVILFSSFFFISFQRLFIFFYDVKWHRFWWKVIFENWNSLKIHLVNACLVIKNSPQKLMPGHWNFTTEMFAWSLNIHLKKSIFKPRLKIFLNHCDCF